MIKKVIGTSLLGLFLGISGTYAANLDQIAVASSKTDKPTIQQSTSGNQKPDKDVTSTNIKIKPETGKDNAAQMKGWTHTEHAFNRPDKTGSSFASSSTWKNGTGMNGNPGMGGSSAPGSGGWSSGSGMGSGTGMSSGSNGGGWNCGPGMGGNPGSRAGR